MFYYLGELDIKKGDKVYNDQTKETLTVAYVDKHSVHFEERYHRRGEFMKKIWKKLENLSET